MKITRLCLANLKYSLVSLSLLLPQQNLCLPTAHGARAKLVLRLQLSQLILYHYKKGNFFIYHYKITGSLISPAK